MSKRISSLIFVGIVGLIAWLILPERPKAFFLDCRENWQISERGTNNSWLIRNYENTSFGILDRTLFLIKIEGRNTHAYVGNFSETDDFYLYKNVEQNLDLSINRKNLNLTYQNSVWICKNISEDEYELEKKNIGR